MKLWEISSDRFSVFALGSERGEQSYVYEKLDKVTERHEDLAVAALALLEEIVPVYGPLLRQTPDGLNPRIHESKAMEGFDDLYYFRVHRRGDRSEPALRIPWFFGSSTEITCTHAFLKRGDTFPNTHKIKARELRRRFLQEQAGAK